MGQSSGCFECRPKGRSGVNDGPEDVHASAGECDDGLMVSLSFAALAFVEGAAVIVGEGAKGGLVEDLSLLKIPSGHEIGLPMKAMADDFGYSNGALLSRAPVSLDGF
jgi:hypothetical protein